MSFHYLIIDSENYLHHLKKQQLLIQPFIIIIGNTVKPKKIIVYFDSIMFKFFFFERKFDMCFKLIFLNLEYRLQTSVIYSTLILQHFDPS